jgi:hypothetical protein
MSMSVVCVHVHGLCPCPWSMSMSMDHIHVLGACQCPCCMSNLCCMSISMLHEISDELKNWCDILKNISQNFLKKDEISRTVRNFVKNSKISLSRNCTNFAGKFSEIRNKNYAKISRNFAYKNIS